MGHSLGGYFAQLAAVKHGAVAHTFNAPGARYEKENSPRKTIINHVRENDLAGRIGQHFGTVLFYPDLDLQVEEYSENALMKGHAVRWLCPQLGPLWKDSLEKLPDIF